MSAFKEIRFPDKIGRGARGGPRRRTRIVALGSGHEERNASWASSRRFYDVSFGIRRSDDLQEVIAFFEAMNGRLYGFRFKDWSDYRSGLPSRAISDEDQLLGTGDGAATAFQLRKGYAAGAETWWRTITKPVASSVRVAVAGVELFTGWSVDAATGIVTFEAAPDEGAAVTAGFEFDVPCRFDTDEIVLELDIERNGAIPTITLAELRL